MLIIVVLLYHAWYKYNDCISSDTNKISIIVIVYELIAFQLYSWWLKTLSWFLVGGQGLNTCVPIASLLVPQAQVRLVEMFLEHTVREGRKLLRRVDVLAAYEGAVGAQLVAHELL